MKNILTNLIRHFRNYPQRLRQTDRRLLFLSIAFPFHTWTIYQVFNDVEWVMARTNPGDVLGYASYSLAFALYESGVIFGAAWLLGSIAPPSWKEETLAVELNWLVWVTALWAGISQFLAVGQETINCQLLGVLFSGGHPLRDAYLLAALLVALVIASVAAPVLRIMLSNKARQRWIAVLERVSLLSYLYLFLDLIGILVILFRNLFS